MRTLFALLTVVIFLVIGYLLLACFWIYGKCNQQKSELYQLRIVQAIFKIVLLISGVKLTVLGEENVPTDEAVLYVANHRSIFDIVIAYARCPNRTGFVAKNSLEKIPALRLWMRRLHCLFLDRADIKQGMTVILTAIQKVKDGISIFIFPEGTRNKNKEDSAHLLPFKGGSFKIAQKSGCKIVPVAITGSNQILEDHFPWIKSTKVVLQYGTPISYKDLSLEDQKHIGAYFEKEIQEMLEEHKKLIK